MNRLAWNRAAGCLALLAAVGSAATIGWAHEGEVEHAHAGTGQVHTSRPDAKALPLPRSSDVFHFVIFGDRTGGPPEGVRILAQAVRDANLLDPDLVMTVGDLVQGYNTQQPWMEQMREFRGIMDGLTMPWFPVAGNHDVYWRGPDKPAGEHEANYEKFFGPLWYAFRHKNAGFVVLYTDEGNLETGEKGYSRPDLVRMSDRQLAWLREALKSLKEADQVFVFLHHPRWIEQSYASGNWNDVHTALAEAGNVRAVFAGHIHRMRYDGQRDGIEYFSLAATGASIPGLHPDIGYLHHMNVVTVRKDTYSVAALPVGSVIDPRQFTARRYTEVDQLRRLAVKRSGPPIELAGNGAAAGYYRVSVTNPTTRPIEVSLTPGDRDAGWFFAPDHRHGQIEPGQAREFEFAYARGVMEITDDLKGPSAILRVDYLEEDMRISIPEQTLEFEVGLRASAVERAEPADGDHSLLLNGRECVVVDSTASSVADGPMTLEAWIRPARFGESQAVAAKTQLSEYGLFLEEGRPHFDLHLNGEYVSAKGPAPLPLDEWSHVAGVFDGAELRLYVNGALVGKTPGAGSRTRNDLPLLIGADPDGAGRPGRWLVGELDEFRLSDHARYQGERFQPAARHEADEHTVALFHCDAMLGPFLVGEAPTNLHGRRLGGLSLVARR